MIPDIEQRFNQLRDKWLQETMFLSSSTAIANNENLKKIVLMGEAVLPYILHDLELTHHHWFSALFEITGEDPVDKNDRGNIAKMTEKWVEWGRLHNYL